MTIHDYALKAKTGQKNIKMYSVTLQVVLGFIHNANKPFMQVYSYKSKSLRSRKPFVLAKPSNFRMHRRHHCLLIAINKNNHEALTFWKSIETKQQ